MNDSFFSVDVTELLLLRKLTLQVWCGLTNAGELIAVKMIELNIKDMEKAEREYEHIQEEVALIKALKHHNIVGYVSSNNEYTQWPDKK